MKDALTITAHGLLTGSQSESLSLPSVNPSDMTSTTTQEIQTVSADSGSSSLGDTPMEEVVPMDWSQWDYLLQDFELPSESTFEL